MELNEILAQFNLREEPAERLSHRTYVKKGHEIADTSEWHKFISHETGIGLFVEMGRNSKIISEVEVLLPNSFEEVYWKTLERLGKETGFMLDEIQRNNYCDENVTNWQTNYDYLQEVRKVYSGLITWLQFVLKKAFAKRNLQSGWNKPEISYVDLTCSDTKVESVPRKNLYLVMQQPAHCRIFYNLEELKEVLAALPSVADAIKDAWQKVEDGTLAYARHLKEVYQPVLSTSTPQSK